uniref:KAT8 regulatory NSL complex subunit 3 (Trinotate prediction) n=1 Tax=Myxobolus squamalis TaxID=59785 RepID=A0A6B2G620_MYXSQ
MKLCMGVDVENVQNDAGYTWIDRFDSFRRNLSSIGTVTFYRTDYVPTIQLDDGEGLKYCVQNLANNIISKIVNIKNRHPACSVILIGWSVSASIAYKIYLSNPKNVQCLILINFPTFYNSGDKKIFSESQIEETKCPIMFITGADSLISKPSDIENLRDSLQCPTSFLYAKHCDDLLNMSLKHRLALNVPQDIIDIKLIEKMSSFIKHHYSGDRMEAYQWELVNNDCFTDSDDIYPTSNLYPF